MAYKGRCLALVALMLLATQAVELAVASEFVAGIESRLDAAALRCLAHPDSVYSYKVGVGIRVSRGRLADRSPLGYVDVYPVREFGPVLDAGQVSRFHALLADEANFDSERTSCFCCYDEPELALVAVAGTERVAVLMSQRCASIWVAYEGITLSCPTDTLATDIWSFMDAVLQGDVNAAASTMSPSGRPWPHSYFERQIAGPSVTDIDDDDRLEITIVNEHDSLTLDYLVTRDGDKYLLAPGVDLRKRSARECRIEPDASQMDVLQGFIEDCRWETPFRTGSRRVRLVWFENDVVVHEEEYRLELPKRDDAVCPAVLWDALGCWQGN